MSLNLFIDANILLSFYGLSPKELEELRKLVALIDAGEVALWIPQHLRDELARNRAKVLAEATRGLREARLKITLPEISRGLPERDALEAASRTAQKAHSALLTALEDRIAARTLEADAILRELFAKGTHVATGPFTQAARLRRDLRHPPGKAESLGDALNWEALLASIPSPEDIHLVTADSDFRSPLGEWRLNDYLAAEWDGKGGAAHLYRDLGAFSKACFPSVDLATDLRKVRAIASLAGSTNFAQTHILVAQLAQFDIFSPEQARTLLQAAAANSQVRWIADDDDVRELLRRIIDAHRDHVDANTVNVLEAAMLTPAPFVDASDDDDIDLPF